MAISEITDSIKINLNQNYWGLLISLISLGLSEYYGLSTLYIFSIIIASVSTLSFIITLIFYTYKYINKKSK